MAGHKTDIGFEIAGERGAVRCSWEREGILEVFRSDDAPLAGFRSVVIDGEQSAGASRARAAVGGFQLLFALQAREFLSAINERRSGEPDFRDGLRTEYVLEASELSASRGRRTNVLSG
jgi:predicted dehydrogenase